MVTADSHVLEKDVVKKKIKNYGKADTKSKISIKKDTIQYSNESIQPYEDEQKSLQEKMKKLNGKEQDLVMKWKKEGGLKGDQGQEYRIKRKISNLKNGV